MQTIRRKKFESLLLLANGLDYRPTLNSRQCVLCVRLSSLVAHGVLQDFCNETSPINQTRSPALISMLLESFDAFNSEESVVFFIRLDDGQDREIFPSPKTHRLNCVLQKQN